MHSVQSIQIQVDMCMWCSVPLWEGNPEIQWLQWHFHVIIVLVDGHRKLLKVLIIIIIALLLYFLEFFLQVLLILECANMRPGTIRGRNKTRADTINITTLPRLYVFCAPIEELPWTNVNIIVWCVYIHTCMTVIVFGQQIHYAFIFHIPIVPRVCNSTCSIIYDNSPELII